jgi:hypothetical protein
MGFVATVMVTATSIRQSRGFTGNNLFLATLDGLTAGRINGQNYFYTVQCTVCLSDSVIIRIYMFAPVYCEK